MEEKEGTHSQRATPWALDYITGAQEGLWGPGVLPLPDFANAPYPAPPGAHKTSQMGLSIL